MPGQKENLQEKLCICLLVKNSQVLILEICKEHMRSNLQRDNRPNISETQRLGNTCVSSNNYNLGKTEKGNKHRHCKKLKLEKKRVQRINFHKRILFFSGGVNTPKKLVSTVSTNPYKTWKLSCQLLTSLMCQFLQVLKENVIQKHERSSQLDQ